MTDQRCDEIRAVIPELAAGVASGDVRADALAHIAGCAACRRELEEVSGTLDELLLLAPEREPPAGFDLRVLNRIGDTAPRRRPLLRTALVLAAAALVVAGAAAGLTWTRSADDRNLADQYRDTLAVGHGSFLRAADITAGGA